MEVGSKIFLQSQSSVFPKTSAIYFVYYYSLKYALFMASVEKSEIQRFGGFFSSSKSPKHKFFPPAFQHI